MAKNIEFMGAVFPDVPSIRLPQYEGGLVSFDDTTDANATAEDIAQGKTAYVNGEKVYGTASGGGGATVAVTGYVKTTSNNSFEISGLKGEPIAFFLMAEQPVKPTSSFSRIIVAVNSVSKEILYTDYSLGTGATQFVQFGTTRIEYTYSDGTLTINVLTGGESSVGRFKANSTYKLTYVY